MLLPRRQPFSVNRQLSSICLEDLLDSRKAAVVRLHAVGSLSETYSLCKVSFRSIDFPSPLVTKLDLVRQCVHRVPVLAQPVLSLLEFQFVNCGL